VDSLLLIMIVLQLENGTKNLNKYILNGNILMVKVKKE